MPALMPSRLLACPPGPSQGPSEGQAGHGLFFHAYTLLISNAPSLLPLQGYSLVTGIGARRWVNVVDQDSAWDDMASNPLPCPPTHLPICPTFACLTA